MEIALGSKSKQIILFVLSAVVYTVIIDWKFAAAVMFITLIHESGHVWAIKSRGLDISGIYFIPLLGASTNIKGKSPGDLPDKDSIFISIMGLVWSLALAIAAVIAYLLTSSPSLAGVISISALLLIVNLIPISITDGARVLRPIALSFNVKQGTFAIFNLGFLLMSSHFWQQGYYILLLMTMLGAYELELEIKKGTLCPRMPTDFAAKYVFAYFAILATTLGLLAYVSGDFIKYFTAWWH